MSQFCVKDFNYISSGKKSKLINLDLETVDGQIVQNNVTFVCGIENNDNIMDYTQNYNKSSLYDYETENIIHNLYDIKDICLKSDTKKIITSKSSYETYKSENYIDIYGPQLDENPIEFIQMTDYTYCLTKQTKQGCYFKQTTLRDKIDENELIDSSYNWNIKNENLKTYIYNGNNYDNIADNFESRINLNNIEYNYMFEIPLNNEFNDFDNGDVHADIFQTKNAYNGYYSMDMDSISSINNCREYCGIGKYCNNLYLKYYDNINYKGIFNNEEEQISAFNMKKIPQKYSFQKIESIATINRFRNNIKHKSNIYSIEIRDTGVNSVINNDEIEDIKKIKMDIKNNIREICKKITPANTQLFDIYFSGV